MEPTRQVIATRAIAADTRRPPIHAGMRGVVTGTHPSGWLAVRFDNGRELLVPPANLQDAD